MAKAKNPGKLTAKPAASAIAPPGQLETGDFPDAMSYINSLAATREGVVWDCRVYQVMQAGRGVKEGQPFLFDCQLEDLPNLEMDLASQYPGGGTFRVQVRADNQLVRIIKLEIAARPGYKPPPPAYLTPVQIPHADNPQTDRMDLFLTRMADMQRAADERIEKLILALAGNKQAAPTMMEQLALFSEFQKLSPKGAQENTFDIFQKGIDFAKTIFEARSDSGGGTSWLDFAREALSSPVVKEVLAAANAAAVQQHNANAPQLAKPVLVSPENPAAAQAIDTLLRQASAGVDPKFVAQQAWDTVPAAVMEELEQQDDVVGYIIAKFPQAASQRAWLTALVAELWEPEQTAPQSPAMQPPNVQPDNSQHPQN